MLSIDQLRAGAGQYRRATEHTSSEHVWHFARRTKARTGTAWKRCSCPGQSLVALLAMADCKISIATRLLTREALKQVIFSSLEHVVECYMIGLITALCWRLAISHPAAADAMVVLLFPIWWDTIRSAESHRSEFRNWYGKCLHCEVCDAPLFRHSKSITPRAFSPRTLIGGLRLMADSWKLQASTVLW